MSRAWVTTLAAGILLLAAFGVLVEPYWRGLATHAWWEIALVLALGIYGACFAAVSIPRILDPRLSIPVLAWGLLLVGFVASAHTKIERAKELGAPNYLDAADKDDFGPGDDRKHMGRGWAVFATLFAFGMMAGSIALVRYFAAHPVAPPAATTRTAPPRPVAEAPAPAPRRRPRSSRSMGLPPRSRSRCPA